eukprot:TRINITY_DN4289_c0_g1_i1.p1 TRINITY_DN4289_c0_g1~~TRINITY_DN4289_c0_g1_i1.p1  ORF type:complete len:157 (-),score=56.82 TRINITY_DN4289_c0_g1_i1:46-516(-)
MRFGLELQSHIAPSEATVLSLSDLLARVCPRGSERAAVERESAQYDGMLGRFHSALEAIVNMYTCYPRADVEKAVKHLWVSSVAFDGLAQPEEHVLVEEFIGSSVTFALWDRIAQGMHAGTVPFPLGKTMVELLELAMAESSVRFSLQDFCHVAGR